MDKNKFSVVMLSFNQAQFVQTAINSVLSQTGVMVELIVVDPGSSDGSREIIQSYGDRVIPIFEKDSGPADGLNKGFQIARGSLFGFLNADDVLLPEALKKAQNFFSRESGIELISGHGFVIDQDGHYLRKVFSDRFAPILFAHGLGIFVQPSSFFRREVFVDTGGFNVLNSTNWDGEFFVQSICRGKKHKVVDDFFSLYRLHKGSITGSGRMARKMEEHRARMFQLLMGRKKNSIDLLIRYLLYAYKYQRNCDALYERIRFGPIYRRFAAAK